MALSNQAYRYRAHLSCLLIESKGPIFQQIWLSVKDKFKKQRDLQSSREFGAYNKSFADSDSLMQDLFMLHAKVAILSSLLLNV